MHMLRPTEAVDARLFTELRPVAGAVLVHGSDHFLRYEGRIDT